MELREFLLKNMEPGKKYALLGIGSPLRSDDGAGMYFIDLLTETLESEHVLLVAGSTAPENFTGVIKDYAPDKLIIVDAAHLGLRPGALKIVPACDIGGCSFSTHMLPLPVMLKYLETEASCDVIFIGIQPKSTEQGFRMCDEVKKGIEELAEIFIEAFRVCP